MILQSEILRISSDPMWNTLKVVIYVRLKFNSLQKNKLRSSNRLYFNISTAWFLLYYLFGLYIFKESEYNDISSCLNNYEVLNISILALKRIVYISTSVCTWIIWEASHITDFKNSQPQQSKLFKKEKAMSISIKLTRILQSIFLNFVFLKFNISQYFRLRSSNRW